MNTPASVDVPRTGANFFRNSPTETSVAKKRAVFVGPARDCAWFLPNVLQNIERLSSLYAESAVVIVENDSSDNTKSILRSWSTSRPNAKLIELDGLAASAPKRTERIAAARNAALDYVRSSPIGSWDHLIMLDLDEVNSTPISQGRFVEAVEFLERQSAAAGVLANQLIAYYDVWTLRSDKWCSGDCMKQVATKPRWMHSDVAKVIYIHSRQIEVPENAPPLRVESAFGGLGIYKLPIIKGYHYQGLCADGSEVSDHVAFNAQITAAGGQLFIYPGLLNQAPSMHLFNSSHFGRREKLLLNLINLWHTILPPWLR